MLDDHRSTMQNNREHGKEFEREVEEALERADVNYSSQEMDAVIGVRDVYVDFVLCTDSGERVALVEAKSGEGREHVQAQVLHDLATDTRANTVIYVTPDGTSGRLSGPVHDVFADCVRLDGMETIASKLDVLEQLRGAGDSRTAFVTCTPTESECAAGRLVAVAHEQEARELAAPGVELEVVDFSPYAAPHTPPATSEPSGHIEPAGELASSSVEMIVDRVDFSSASPDPGCTAIAAQASLIAPRDASFESAREFASTPSGCG